MNNYNFKPKNNISYSDNNNLSLWKRGKKDIKLFYEVNFKKSTNIKTFVFGLLLTLIVILPFALLLTQFYKAYIYNLDIRALLIIIGWVMIWICNGLSNYFTIKLAKIYYKEDPKLQSIDEVAVFFYETLNPGFIIFSTFILIFVFIGLMGV